MGQALVVTVTVTAMCAQHDPLVDAVFTSDTDILKDIGLNVMRYYLLIECPIIGYKQFMIGGMEDSSERALV